MTTLNRTASNWSAEERRKINENWERIEGNFTGVLNTVTQKAFDRVVDAARLTWKEPVDTFADLTTVYPDAIEGWASWSREIENGVSKAYRFNGTEWLELQDFSSDAISEVDTRLNNAIEKTEGIILYATGADDSANFITANARAKALNTHVRLVDGNYSVNESVNGITLAPISGNNCTLTINGNVSFNYNADFYLENINLVCTQFFDYTAATEVLIARQGTSTVSNIRLENVNYITNVNLLDGTQKGKTLIRTYAESVQIKNVSIRNVKQGIIIDATAIKSKEILVDNFQIYNFQTGIYLKGGDINSTSVTYAEGVRFNNIKGVNTLEQQPRYSQLNGADLLTFEAVKNVIITNIYAERVSERALYINVVEDITISNLELIDCGGVKVVGFVDKSLGIFNYSRNAKISNLSVRGNFEERAVTLYEIRDVFIDNVSVVNTFQNASDVIILIERRCENVTVSNVNGVNSKRGCIGFVTRNNATYDNYFKNITIKNVNFLNPCRQTYDMYGIQALVVEGLTGYIFNNIKIENVNFENQVLGAVDQNAPIFPYASNARLVGFITMNNVDGLSIKSSTVTGISDINGGFDIKSNSRNVNIDTLINVFNAYYCPLSLYNSFSSEITVLRSDSSKNSIFRNVITPFYDGAANGLTFNLLNRHSGNVSGTLTLKAAERENQFVYDIVNSRQATLRISTLSGQYAEFSVNASNVVKVSGSDGFVVGVSADKLYVAVVNGKLAIGNNTANSETLNINMSYTNYV